MTSASGMISRLDTIHRQHYGYSEDEIIKIEQLALLDEILSELRQLKIHIAALKEVKE